MGPDFVPCAHGESNTENPRTEINDGIDMCQGGKGSSYPSVIFFYRLPPGAEPISEKLIGKYINFSGFYFLRHYPCVLLARRKDYD